VDAPAPKRALPPLDRACTKDADCAITYDELTDNLPHTYACCSGCSPHAVSTAWNTKFRAACDAAPPPMCPPIGCAMAPQRAVCTSGACTLAPVR